MWFVPAGAQVNPRISVSALQVTDGAEIDVKATGFTPDQAVFSHLKKPDQTEYPVLLFHAGTRGEFTHTIETLLLLPGTHELWMVDDRTGAVSNLARFTVGFGGASAVSPEVENSVAPYAGVWRGTAAHNIPPVASRILVTLTGKPGAAAGTFAYPDHSCGGVLEYRTVTRDFLELTEAVSFGADRCNDRGVLKIRMAAGGRMDLEWLHPDLSSAARSSLTRID